MSHLSKDLDTAEIEDLVTAGTPLGTSRALQRDRFRRWLKEHDAEVKAAALELAADECDELAVGPPTRDVIKDYLHAWAAKHREEKA